MEALNGDLGWFGTGVAGGIVFGLPMRLLEIQARRFARNRWRS
jgi:hypothetical protein